MSKEDRSTPKLLDSVYKYAIAALLIFIPLYPKFPLFNVPFTYVAIRSEDFLVALLWVLLLLKLWFDRPFKLPPIATQIAVFLLIGLFSSISAILITKNVQPILVLLHYFRRIEYLSAFIFVYYAGKHVKDRRFYLEVFLFPVIGVFIYGIAQIYFQAPVISTMDSESSKGLALTLRPGVTLSSTFAGHYDLAIYLIMMMSILVAISSRIKVKAYHLLNFASFSALMWLFMQAGSRISLAGIYLSIAIITFINRKYLLGVAFALIVSVGVVSSPQIYSRLLNLVKVIKLQTSYIVPSAAYAASKPIPTSSLTPAPTPTPEIPRAIQTDRSTSIRLDVEWPRAFRSFYKNPFFGTGYSSLTLATDNDYLRALGETGLLGLLSFVALLIAVFRALVQRLKPEGMDHVITVSALGFFVAFLASAIFIDVFEASKIAIMFWAYMGLAISTKKS